MRAVHGDKQAFAYSDDITLAALDEAARRGARDRPAGAVGGRRRSARVGAARALYAPQDPVASLPDEAKVALLERLEQHGARARSARHAGDGVARRRVRGDPDRAQRRPDRRRRAAARARVAHRDRRGERPARAGLRRRRRALRLRAISPTRCSTRYATQAVDQALLNLGARDAPAGNDDRRARPRLARHPAARGDRPRPRRRLQPQGHERVLRPRRPARRGEGRHRRRRRHDRPAPRLAQHRRRRQPDAAHGADRGRHPARATCRTGSTRG